jgi:hypothetical protein
LTAGALQANVLETIAWPAPWTLSSPSAAAPGVITQSAAVAYPAAGATTAASLTAAVPLAPVARPTMTGKVEDHTDSSAVAGAIVYVCPAAAATCDASTAVPGGTAGTDGNGAFTLYPDAGSFQVTAVKGAATATVTGIAVSAAGALTVPGGNLVVTI